MRQIGALTTGGNPARIESEGCSKSLSRHDSFFEGLERAAGATNKEHRMAGEAEMVRR